MECVTSKIHKTQTDLAAVGLASFLPPSFLEGGVGAGNERYKMQQFAFYFGE